MTKKDFNPKAFEGTIVKSWDVGSDVHFEGWLSTPSRDMEKDVTEPEAFLHGIDKYFSKRAPISIEHDGKNLPIGHLQKASVVRDGLVLKAAYHPSDSQDFEHFTGTGTGVWVRGVVNEEPGISAIRKGNVGGMSFIGNATEYEPLPGGRHRYLKIDPWIESTIAAYPINPDAVIAVAKAFGLQDTEKKETPSMNLEEVMVEAEKKTAEDKKVQDAQSITKADLGQVLGELKTSIAQEVKTLVDAQVAEVKKAFEDATPAAQRGEGVGRKGTLDVQKGSKTELTLEDNPLEYVVEKASKLTDDTSELSIEERVILNELMQRALLMGLHE